MGLVELYRTTREPRYLELANRLVAVRDTIKDGTDDNQDRVPFREQRKAVGHAVRANYLYAGAADLYAKVPKFVLPEPANANKLGYVQPGTAGEVIAQNLQSAQGFPHRAAMTPPVCTGTP